MGVMDALRNLRWHLAGHGRPLPEAFTAPAVGTRVLEIGGPSALFATGGVLPLYPVAAAVDGVQWSAETTWHGRQDGGDYVPDGERRGRMVVVDDLDLPNVPDDAYDVIASSHVIEHFANPLRALAAWRRIVRPGGHVLLVAPHKEGTFDHRRPVTPLEHLVADFEQGTTEDDLTHLDETLRLHDRSRDSDPDDDATWEAKRRANAEHRLLHHHVFTTRSLLAMLDHAGLEIVAATARWPHDIYVLGRWPHDGPSGNARWLGDDSPAVAGSPFRADHNGAG